MNSQPSKGEQLAHQLNACAQGDRQALAQIHESQAPQLYALCTHMLGDEDDAELALHSGFARVWVLAGEFNNETQNASAWIVQNIREEALALLESRYIDHSTLNKPLDNTASNDTGSELNATAKLQGTQLDQSLLPAAFQSLTPPIFTLIEQMYLKGLNYERLGNLNNDDPKSIRHSVRIGLGQFDEFHDFNSPDKDWWIKQSGEFALNALRNDELKVFEKIRLHEPEVQHLVDQWHETLSPLLHALPSVEAPNLDWTKIDALSSSHQASEQSATRSAATHAITQADDSDAETERYLSAEYAQLRQEHERITSDNAELQTLLSKQKKVLQSERKSANGWRMFSALLVAAALVLTIGLAQYSHKNPAQLSFLNFASNAAEVDTSANLPD